jgi:hypothetical protein
VAGLRQDDEPRRLDLPLHEERGLETRLVLVAGDEERWHVEAHELRLEIEDRGARHLHAAQRQGIPRRRSLRELGVKLLPTERILVDELPARGPPRLEVGDGGHAVRLEALRDKRRSSPRKATVGPDAAVAAAGDGQRERPVRVAEAEDDMARLARGTSPRGLPCYRRAAARRRRAQVGRVEQKWGNPAGVAAGRRVRQASAARPSAATGRARRRSGRARGPRCDRRPARASAADDRTPEPAA